MRPLPAGRLPPVAGDRAPEAARRCDGEDPFISTARHDRQREETAEVATRMVAALLADDEGIRAAAASYRGRKR
ncbi:hypothetical protein AB0C14_13560 [Microbispora hainanensis]|uniref:hypothetical protein n=1 Tax=Microbispora hainanensis TaxID=568844 RepID=UPI003404F5DB